MDHEGSLIPLFTLTDDHIAALGIVEMYWIVALALHPGKPEMVVCLDGGDVMHLVRVNLDTSEVHLLCTTEPEAVCSLRCERLTYLEEGCKLLAVFNAECSRKLFKPYILLWDETGTLHTMADPIGFANPKQELNIVAVHYHAPDRRLYYQFRGEGKLHSVAFDGRPTRLHLSNEDLRSIFPGPENTLILSFDGAAFQEFHPGRGAAIRPLYQDVVDFPAVGGFVSGDGKCFCSIHPYDYHWYDKEFTDRDQNGGIYFWEWNESERLKLVSRYVCVRDVGQDNLANFKPLRGRAGAAFVVIEPLGSSRRRLSRIDQTGVQATLELPESMQYPCLNALDYSDRILIGAGRKVYEWRA